MKFAGFKMQELHSAFAVALSWDSKLIRILQFACPQNPFWGCDDLLLRT